MYPRPRLILCLGDPLAVGPFLPGARSWAAGIPGSRSRNLRCRPAGRPSPEPAAGAAPPIPITTVRSSRSADPSTAAFCNVTSRCKKALTSSDFGSTGTADVHGCVISDTGWLIRVDKPDLRTGANPVSPVRLRTSDLAVQDSTSFCSTKISTSFRGVAAGKQCHPAGEPDHELAGEAEGRQYRGLKP